MRLLICVGMLLLAGVQSASAEDIALRLLNARSGEPLRQIPVTVFFWNGPTTFRPDNIPNGEVIAHATTDKEGRAVFHLPQPVPEHMGFSVSLWDFGGCSRLHNSSPEK